MEALKDRFAILAQRIKEATDHDSLMKAVDAMTKFLAEEKNRIAVADTAANSRTAESSN